MAWKPGLKYSDICQRNSHGGFRTVFFFFVKWEEVRANILLLVCLQHYRNHFFFVFVVIFHTCSRRWRRSHTSRSNNSGSSFVVDVEIDVSYFRLFWANGEYSKSRNTQNNSRSKDTNVPPSKTPSLIATDGRTDGWKDTWTDWQIKEIMVLIYHPAHGRDTVSVNNMAEL